MEYDFITLKFHYGKKDPVIGHIVLPTDASDSVGIVKAIESEAGWSPHIDLDHVEEISRMRLSAEDVWSLRLESGAVYMEVNPCN